MAFIARYGDQGTLSDLTDSSFFPPMCKKPLALLYYPIFKKRNTTFHQVVAVPSKDSLSSILTLHIQSSGELTKGEKNRIMGMQEALRSHM